ncbi:hypothetical protein [Paraburkholderia kururiensis]|uniref:hypothetical protein n=1 Tax=Paraburkholderia kururiensis TaxID=984307 RepID=UPI001267E973|nr:hypothetical protein [Paraburkholderia kururiensis]
MESTFSAQFETIQQGDGSTTIKYRVKIHQGPNAAKANAFAFFGSLVYLYFTWGFSLVSKLIALVMVIFYVLCVYKYILGRAKSVTIIPGQGLRWSHHQLPFSEIKDFGVMRVQVNSMGQHNVSGYVYAESRGREIAVTEHVPFALASAIRDEIHNRSFIVI